MFCSGCHFSLVNAGDVEEEELYHIIFHIVSHVKAESRVLQA